LQRVNNQKKENLAIGSGTKEKIRRIKNNSSKNEKEEGQVCKGTD